MGAPVTQDFVPLQAPWYGPEEEEAVRVALRQGTGVGGGPIGRRVEQAMARIFDVRHVLLTTSATHALELAILALGLGPGDEVIMPSFTFASCANAVALRGARPVDALLALARRHGLRVIEDTAQAVDARYKGRYLGTLGDVGCYSFHATKNLSCGEGGAFLTNHDDLAQRAEIIREKGTNRQAFLRGEVDKYTWVAAGSSYVLSDLLAAILEAQLAKREAIRARRKALWEAYADDLAPLAAAGVLRLPVIPPGCDSNYHLFFLRTRTPAERDRLLAALREERISATFHYVPLHSAPYAQEVYGVTPDLRVTEHASKTLVRLPLFPQLSTDICRHITNAVRMVMGQ